MVNRLLTRTKNDDQKWDSLPSGFEFGTSGKKFRYFVGSIDKDDLAPHALEVWKIRDDVEDHQQSSTPLQVIHTSEFDEINGPLQELYELVKRKALNIDEITAELLSDLD